MERPSVWLPESGSSITDAMNCAYFPQVLCSRHSKANDANLRVPSLIDTVGADSKLTQ